MYLFNRMRLHNGQNGGSTRAAFTNAATVATRVTGIPTFTWQVSYHPMGNGWMTSARVETQAQLEEAWAKMAASSEMLDAMEEVARLAPSPPVDNIARIVGGSLGDRPATIVRATVATAAPGQIGPAVGWLVQMATTGSAALGVPIAATMNVAGTYGGMALITSYESAEQVDQVADKLMVDESLQQMIADGAHLFAGESAQMMLRRMN